jgi:hypothetical protein
MFIGFSFLSLLFLSSFVDDQVFQYSLDADRFQRHIPVNIRLTEKAGFAVDSSCAFGAYAQGATGMIVISHRAVQMLVNIIEDIHGTHPFFKGHLIASECGLLIRGGIEAKDPGIDINGHFDLPYCHELIFPTNMDRLLKNVQMQGAQKPKSEAYTTIRRTQHRACPEFIEGQQRGVWGQPLNVFPPYLSETPSFFSSYRNRA